MRLQVELAVIETNRQTERSFVGRTRVGFLGAGQLGNKKESKSATPACRLGRTRRWFAAGSGAGAGAGAAGLGPAAPGRRPSTASSRRNSGSW